MAPIGADRFGEVNMTIGEQLKSFCQLAWRANWQNRQFAHLGDSISTVILILM